MSIAFIDLHPAPTDLEHLVQEGLQRQPRQLPAWLLYDAEGSKLFAAICDQPEYGLTRTEIALLESHAADIADAVGSGVVVEFGIGNAKKVDPLLRALRPKTFVALDISRSALGDSLTGLAAEHPTTQMLGICCDHSRLQALPTHPWLTGERRIGFFPGSSLGNFTPKDAVHLLQRFRHLLAGGPLLLGLDQPRDPALLEAAYDDAAGVSKAFAFNLLKRLNRDLKGNAEANNFRYEARWQADQQRIEMALVSRCAQTIQLAESAWSFEPNERWVTEHSVKYSPDAAAHLAAQAGWQIQQRWHDDHDQISLHLLVPSNLDRQEPSTVMKQDERRQAIKQERERLIQDLEALYLAAFDRLGTLEGEVGEVKAAQLTQMILNSKLAALEPLLKEIEKPLITTPAGDQK